MRLSVACATGSTMQRQVGGVLDQLLHKVKDLVAQVVLVFERFVQGNNGAIAVLLRRCGVVGPGVVDLLQM